MVRYPLIQRFFSLLQFDCTLNSDTHKYFLNFPISHPLVYDSTTNRCLNFSIGGTVDLDMKEIDRREIILGTCQIHTFHRIFLVYMNFLPLLSHLIAEVLIPLCPCYSMA